MGSERIPAAAPGVAPWEVAGAEGERRPNREYNTQNPKPGLEAAEAAKAARRRPHIQSLEESVDRATFEHTRFVARYLDHVTNRNGDMVFRVHVHRREVPKALMLMDALGLPLSFDVERWRNYDAVRGNTDDNGA